MSTVVVNGVDGLLLPDEERHRSNAARVARASRESQRRRSKRRTSVRLVVVVARMEVGPEATRLEEVERPHCPRAHPALHVLPCAALGRDLNGSALLAVQQGKRVSERIDGLGALAVVGPGGESDAGVHLLVPRHLGARCELADRDAKLPVGDVAPASASRDAGLSPYNERLRVGNPNIGRRPALASSSLNSS